MRQDYTFDPSSAYGSEAWCAKTLGVSRDWFWRHRAKLEADGFPARDALMNRTNKADVLAWIARRRRLPDAVVITSPPESQEDLDAL